MTLLGCPSRRSLDWATIAQVGHPRSKLTSTRLNDKPFQRQLKDSVKKYVTGDGASVDPEIQQKALLALEFLWWESGLHDGKVLTETAWLSQFGDVVSVPQRPVE